jgi:very-short-patch-repair endonuclease
VGRADLPIKGRWMAAVLACGDGAVLSHRSAATLHGLVDARAGRIEVAVPRRTPVRRPGLRVHRSTYPGPEDRTIVDGIPCTNVPATLLSLAATSPRNILESACNKAEIREALDMAAIGELLDRRRSQPGTARLRAAVEVGGLGTDRTKSDLERRFALLVREDGLPAPEVNAWIAIPGEEMQCDFAWHRQRVIVEVDGWDTHRTRRAFHEDRRRDRLLRVHGWDVLRFTHRDVARDPGQVMSAVHAIVRAAASVPGGTDPPSPSPRAAVRP